MYKITRKTILNGIPFEKGQEVKLTSDEAKAFGKCAEKIVTKKKSKKK